MLSCYVISAVMLRSSPRYYWAGGGIYHEVFISTGISGCIRNFILNEVVNPLPAWDCRVIHLVTWTLFWYIMTHLRQQLLRFLHKRTIGELYMEHVIATRYIKGNFIGLHDHRDNFGDLLGHEWAIAHHSSLCDVYNNILTTTKIYCHWSSNIKEW